MKKLVVLSLLLITIIFSGCFNQGDYYCPDGTIVSNPSLCPITTTTTKTSTTTTIPLTTSTTSTTMYSTTTTTIIIQACSEGTPYNQCSRFWFEKPKFCENGVLVNKCSVCGCLADYGCQSDGSCSLVYSFPNCRGEICDGFCYTNKEDRKDQVCRDDVINNQNYDVYLNYPKSVPFNEYFDLEITIKTKESPLYIDFMGATFWEWGHGPTGTSFHYENKTTYNIQIQPNSEEKVYYKLKSTPTVSPYTGKIVIDSSLYQFLGYTNSITIYDPTNYKVCGEKKYDPRYGTCCENIFFPAREGRGCCSNSDCNYSSNPVCIDHECEGRRVPPYGNPTFYANKSYKAAFIPLYTLLNKSLSEELSVTEKSYMNSIAYNASKWFESEKAYWKTNKPFSLSYEVIDCGIYRDEYVEIINQKYTGSNPKDVFDEITRRCNLDRKEYEIVAFIQVLDPDDHELDQIFPDWGSVSYGDIVRASGFYYYKEDDSRAKYYSRGDLVEILIHETLHSFGLNDVYTYPGLKYHQYDCFFNILQNTRIEDRHLCPMEAFMLGLI